VPEPVIEAHKNRLGESVVVGLLVARALRSQFHTIWWHADPAALALRRPPPAGRVPVIFASTHPSWWDGYLSWPINHALGGRDGYLMMDVRSLRSYRFFTWGGAFGIDRADPRAALASIEYISGVLNAAPNRAVWMFPQGTITPPDRRPLGLYPGVAHIARRLPAALIVPVAWRVAYRWEQRAEIFIRVGAPLAVDGGRSLPSRALTARLEAALIAEDDRLAAELRDGDMARPLPGYAVLLRGRTSVNRLWERVRARTLRLAGRRPPPAAP